MKNFKKKTARVFLLVVLGVLVFALVACNNNSPINTDPIDDVAAKELIQQARQTTPLPSSAVTGLTKMVSDAYSFEEITTLQTAEVKNIRTALQQAGISLNPTAGYNTSYEKVVAKTTFSDLELWGADDVIFWPGAIVRVVDPTKSDSPITSFGLPSGTITLSASMYTATGTNAGAAAPRVVENATLASVKEAINSIQNGYLTQGSNHGTKFSAEISEVKSREELELFSLATSSNSPSSVMASSLPQSEKTIVQNELGEDIGNVSVGSGSSSSSATDSTFIRISLKQIFYTIDVNNINNPSEIFAPSVTQTQLASALATGGIPAYVSSVSYGMRAEIFIETSMSFSEFKNENSISKSIYDLNKEGEIAETLEALADLYKDGGGTEKVIKNMDCFIYGGSGLSGADFDSTTDAGEVLEIFDSVTKDPTKWVGVPLSFQIRHIDGSNSLIQVGKANEYYRRVLTPIPVDSIYFTEEQKAVIDTVRGGGDRVLLEATASPDTAILYKPTFTLIAVNGIQSNSLNIDNSNPRLSRIVNVAEIVAEDVFENGENVTKYYLTILDPYRSSEFNIYADKGLVIKATAGDKSATYTVPIVSISIASMVFDSRGGSDIATQFIPMGNFINAPEPPTNSDGSYFGGWYTSTSFTSATRFDFSKPITKDVTLYARWLHDSPVGILFVTNSNDIEDILDESFLVNETVLFPHVYRSGYTLDGWYKDALFTQKWNAAADKAEDTVVYAKWNIVTYNITYNLNGGTNGSNPSSFTVQSSNIDFVNPTKFGYTFMGWYDSPTFDGTPITMLTKGSRVQDLELFAKWQVTIYTITYLDEHETQVSNNPSTFTVETQTFTFNNPQKDGYHFEGWFDNDNNKLTGIVKGSTTKDILLTANWTIVVYTITYDNLLAEENPNISITTYTIESETITFASPTRKGYIGTWSIPSIQKGSIGNKVIEAQWHPMTTIVSFNSSGGSGGQSSSMTATYDSKMPVISSSPTRKGYTFAGYFDAASGGKKYYNSDLSSAKTWDKEDASITLFAQWTLITYTITYNLTGGTASNPADYNIEAANFTLNNPTRTGYTFVGWSGTGITGFSKSVVIGKGSTGNREYRVHWSANVEAGYIHGFTIDSAGNLKGFGFYDNGRLANNQSGGNTNGNQVAIAHPNGLKWLSVSGGEYHTLAIDSNNKLWAFGNNDNGQLGDGTFVQRLTPVPVRHDLSFAFVSAARYHSLGITMSGDLYTWGHDGNGRLGNGSSTTTNQHSPKQIMSGTKFMAVAAGEAHSLAITMSGVLYAWGYDGNGRLGNGSSTTADQHTPVIIKQGTTFVAVSASNAHSLAIDASGNVWAWGHDGNGRLGDGGNNTDQTAPVKTVNNTNAKFVAIAAGYHFSMAIDSGGNLWGWGNNGRGCQGTTTGGEGDFTSPRLISSGGYLSLSAGHKYTVVMRTSGGVAVASILGSVGWDGCIASGTLITLADGTQVPVESLKGDEMLLVWNPFTGTFDTAPILFIDSDPEQDCEIVILYFSDGTEVKVIYEHGFWNFDLNKYVFLRNDASKYIGHWFNKQTIDNDGTLLWTNVQLVDVVISVERTVAWSPVTFAHLCYYVNGMLSMPGATEGLINIFEVNPTTMQYDQTAYLEDIALYGLFTYEEFAELLPVPELIFEAFGGAYLKVALGKGLLTWDMLYALIDRYSVFWI